MQSRGALGRLCCLEEWFGEMTGDERKECLDINVHMLIVPS